MELIFRFIIGGLIVTLFAVMSDVLKPRTFAGLFAASPSVALASLGLTMLADGKLYAAAEARSMIAGAVALLLYAFVTIRLLTRLKLHAAQATIYALPVWLISSVGAWLLMPR